MTTKPDIVLVHGAWADGDLMRLVIEHLQADGYRVTAPPFPMTRLAEDLARPRQVLARQGGPTVVAGHSDGGQIITALGTDPPNLVGLVYSAAFGLAEGASIGALLDQGPPGPALAHLDVDQHGFAWLPEHDFVNHVAADLDPVGHGQVRGPAAVALERPRRGDGRPGLEVAADLVPDRRRRPGDPARCPAAVRPRMGATTVEVSTNHVAMVSHPAELLQLIKTAAEGAAG